MLRRWLPLVAVFVALLHGVPACMSDSSDTRLNPQPLPPGDPPEGTGAPPSSGKDDSSSSSGGMSPGDADAGASADAAADAADAADGEGDQ